MSDTKLVKPQLDITNSPFYPNRVPNADIGIPPSGNILAYQYFMIPYSTFVTLHNYIYISLLVGLHYPLEWSILDMLCSRPRSEAKGEIGSISMVYTVLYYPFRFCLLSPTWSLPVPPSPITPSYPLPSSYLTPSSSSYPASPRH